MGSGRRFPKASALLTARCRKDRSAHTSSRPPSPPSMMKQPRAEDTDWPQILALYELLKRMSDNPMVALNHAIAAAMVHGPSKGLELLQRSTLTRGSPGIIAWTRSALIYWKWPALTRRPSHYRVAASRPRAFPSAII